MQSLLYEIYSTLLVPRYRYDDSYSQLRARVTLLLGTVIAAAALLLLVRTASVGARTQQVTDILTASLAIMLVQLLIIGLVHAGQLRVAAAAMFAFLLAMSALVLATEGIGSSALLILALPLLYGSLILPWSSVLVTTAAVCVLILIVASAQASGGLTLQGAVRIASEDLPTQTLNLIVILAVSGILTALFAAETGRSMRNSRRLLTQLRATAEVAQLAASVESANEMLMRLVHYIRDRFGFYHVQVFLVDAERRYANLAASTGSIGEMLMGRGYRLTLGTQSAIGSALQIGEPVVISREAGESSGRRVNELLPDTRSQLVLPLIVGDQVIGALDVQSARPNFFTAELIESLRALAGQVGALTYTARQADETRSSLNETRRLFLETEVNLREAQRLNQRLTGQAWEDYLKSRSAQIVGYTLHDDRLQRDAGWTATLEQAAGSRRPVITAGRNNRQIVAVPIELRGRAIGALEIEMEGVIRQAETLEVLQSLAQRLALSIDNARLFEQAQELAQRELEVNAISTRLQSINDIDELARTTLQELSRALGAETASIRLGAMRQRPESASASAAVPPAMPPEHTAQVNEAAG